MTNSNSDTEPVPSFKKKGLVRVQGVTQLSEHKTPAESQVDPPKSLTHREGCTEDRIFSASVS